MSARNTPWLGTCNLGPLELRAGASGTLSFRWPASINTFSRLTFDVPAYGNNMTISYDLKTTQPVTQPSREQVVIALQDLCNELRTAVRSANQQIR